MQVAGYVDNIPSSGDTGDKASSALGLVIHRTLPVSTLLAFPQLFIGRVGVSLVVNEIGASVGAHILR